MREDPLNDLRIGNRDDEPQPAAAARARQHVEVEGARRRESAHALATMAPNHFRVKSG